MILPSRLLVADVLDEHPLFRREDKLVCLGEFRAEVAALKDAIEQSGAKRAVLYSDDNYEFAVGLMACLYAGVHTVLPGNLCENNRERLLVEGSVLVSGLAPVENHSSLTAPDASLVNVEFYTSGSTGEPKQIVRSFAALEAELCALGHVFDASEPAPDVFPTVSFHHAYGIIFGLLLPLSRGLVSDTTPFGGLESYLNRVRQYAAAGRLAWLVTTPAFLRVWAEHADMYTLDHRPVRVLSAGAPLPAEVAERVADASGARISEIFGSSETGVVAHRYPLEDAAWQPFPDTRIELVEGEGMRIASPTVHPAECAMLGDSAKWLPDGRFHLLPRVDRIVKLADKRISLVEVEQCLQESPLVKQACALVLPEQRVPRLAVAVVLTREGEMLLQAQGYAAMKKALRAVLACQVEHTLLPRRWRIVGELPVNAQGKVQVSAVAALFESRLQLPLVVPESVSPDRLSLRVLYVKDSSYLAGHFPGYPIVPGVVILQSLSHALQQYWGLELKGITRLKFSAETLPGCWQQVQLTRKGDSVAVEITLAESGVKACQGRLIVC